MLEVLFFSLTPKLELVRLGFYMVAAIILLAYLNIRENLKNQKK